MGKARGVFSGLRAIRGRATVDAATWEELEEVLLRADVGVATTQTLLADLRRRVQAKDVAGGDGLLGALRADLLDLLDVEQRWDAATDAELAADAHPTGERPVPPADDEIVAPVGRDLRFDEADDVVNVWLFVGVNGVGKTTTVGKLARQQAAAGRSVLLAAGDTFRAAAGEQLAMWADRSGAEIVRGAEGGDPSAIVFDAVQRAAARGNRLVLADTAGRLHTKVNLVEELKKIRRVADRPPGRVTEVLLVLDATTGQNGLVQARQFTEAVEVTGVVLTKLDGSAKGGVVIAVQRDLGLPGQARRPRRGARTTSSRSTPRSSSTPCSADRADLGRHRLRRLRRLLHDGHVRPGAAGPTVHPALRRRLPAVERLWLPLGRVALRRGRGRCGRSSPFGGSGSSGSS